MELIIEIFERIKDDNGNDTNYIISDYGTCYNTKTGNLIKPIEDATGRKSLSLHLCKKGKTTKSIAQYIMNAFNIEKPSEKHNQVDHIDGNKLNDNLYNFEWVTASENIKRAYKTGCKKPNNTISDTEIQQVIKLIVCGYSNKEIHEMTNVKTSIISCIRTGRCHKNKSKNYNFIKEYKPRKSPVKFDEELKARIRELISKGYNNKAIINELGIHYNKSIQYLLANIRRKMNS